jgi:D-alanine-D-alanine ligase-like ATP-grasp enzyme
MKIGLLYKIPPTTGTETPQRQAAEIRYLMSTLVNLGFEVADIGGLDRLASLVSAGHRLDLVFQDVFGRCESSPDTRVSEFLEMHQIPHTGADAQTCACCADHAGARRCWRQRGLPTGEDPMPKGFRGRRFAVGLLGGNGDAGAFGVVERFSAAACASGAEASSTIRQTGSFAPGVVPRLRQQLCDLARRAYLAMACQGLAQVEIGFAQDQQPKLIEILANPGILPGSATIPGIAQSAGMSYEVLVGEIIHLALRMHADQAERWLRNTYLKDTGSSRGLGVFAGRPFRKGDTVARAAGEVIPFQTEYSIQIDWHRHLDVDAPVRQMNHSCSPNLGVRTSGNGLPVFVALHDIALDEELTWDYAMTEYTHYRRENPDMEFDLDCHCGAPDCRGKFGYYAELPEALKQKYAGYVSDYLLTKRSA